MLKRLIAGILSASLCTSAFSASSAVMSGNTASCPESSGTDSKSEYDIHASNSLGRYIADYAKEHDLQMMSDTETSAEYFEITAFDLDRDTGNFSVSSSQTRNCILQFDFFDDSAKTLVRSEKINVPAGKFVNTDGIIDANGLPEFYFIKAYLTDENGLRLSKEYSNNVYTQKMQEIAETDIYDFPEKNVINFDENTDTNFIVLSDGTVTAESTEDTNKLLSADYDNNVFVFENADETVQSMEFGQYLYIQPDEENIIALSVEDISTDGNITTVSGSGDIEDMFAFMKFESVTETAETTFDNSETGIGYEYVTDLDTGETVVAFDEDDVAEKVSETFEQYGIDISESYSSSVSISDTAVSVGGFSFKPSVTLSVTTSINFYSGWDYTEFEFSIEKTLSVAATLKASIGNDVNIPLVPRSENRLGVLNIPTQVPGLAITIGLYFVYEFSAELQISLSLTEKIGFLYTDDDGDTEFTPIHTYETVSFNWKVKGTIFIGIKLEVGLAVVDPWVCSATLTATVGFKITGSASATLTYSRNGLSGTSSVISGLDSSLDSIHACSTCIDGDVNIVFSIGVSLKLCGSDLNFTIAELSIKLGDWYLSFGDLDPAASPIDPVVDTDNWLSEANENFLEFGIGECPNKAYRVTLTYNITDATEYSDEDIENRNTALEHISLTVDGVDISTIPISNQYKFYCRDGQHRAVLKVGSHTFSQTFTVHGSAKSVTIAGRINDDGTQGNTPDPNANSSSDEPVVTTQATLASVDPVTTGEQKSRAPKALETVQLGEHITGTIYSNGYMYIFGYGDMYDFNGAAFSHGDVVRQVMFENRDTEKGLVITSIGANVFNGFSNLDSSSCSRDVKPVDNVFVMPKTVTAIGVSAFSGCSSLKDIRLHSGIVTIGEYAFRGCKSLTHLIVPDSVTQMGIMMLNGCTSLETLQIPFAADKMSCAEAEGVNNQYDSVADLFIVISWSWDNYGMDFSDYAISEITITGGDKIPDYAFSSMTTLKKIDLSKSSIKNIGNYAFWNCNSLSEVIIPDTVTDIGNYAYYSTKVTKLPDNKKIRSIGDYSFSGCQNLDITTIPSSYKKLGDFALQNCTGIKKLVIPPTVESIGHQIFNGCTSLSDLTLPYASRNEISTYSEAELNQYLSVADMFMNISWSWDNKGMDFKPYSISKIKITGGGTIPDNAFSSMTTLKEIDLSDTQISSIGSYAFSDCTALENIILPESLKSIDTCAFINCTSVKKFNLNDGLDHIGSYAFGNCTGITSLVIPESVTAMDDRMLNGCTSLETLQIPYAATEKAVACNEKNNDQYDSVADLFMVISWSWDNYGMDFSDYAISKIIVTGGYKVPSYAFASMTTLKEVDLSGSATEQIGDYAFWNCSSLADIKISDKTESIGDYAYYGTPITALPDSGNIKSIGNYAFLECQKLTDFTIPSSYEILGEGVFANCKGIKKLVIPKNVTTMGALLFNGCTSLAELTLPYAATNLACTKSDGYIDQYMSVSDLFMNIAWSWDNASVDYSPYAITKITITGGEIIPQYAFSGMTTLKEIDLSNTKATILGTFSFSACRSLEKITLPSSIKSINSYAFSNCTALEHIELNNGLREIGEYAFHNCTGLRSLVIPDSVDTMNQYMLNGCVLLETLQIPFAATRKNCTDIDGVVDQYCSVPDLFYSAAWNWENTSIDYSGYAISKIIVTGGEKIPDYAFSGLTPLREVDLYDSGIEYIGKYAFNGCTGLNAVEIPKDTDIVSENAFRNVSGDVYFYDKASKIADNSFNKDYSGTIHGYANSTAKSFADRGSYKFVPFDGEVIIGPKNVSMAVGDTYEIKSDYSVLEYVSSDEKIAIVNKEGFINAVASGKSVIKATASNGDSCTMNVNVRMPATTTTTTATTTTSVVGSSSVTLTVETTSVSGVSSTAKQTTSTTTSRVTTTTKPITSTTTSSNITTTTTSTTAIAVSSETDSSLTSVETTISETSSITVTETSVTSSDITTSVPQTTYTLGDVNNDNSVDARDASIVLMNYVLASAGFDISLSDEQIKASDVNEDGQIDARDASVILTYYAYSSATNAGTLKEFIFIFYYSDSKQPSDQ